MPELDVRPQEPDFIGEGDFPPEFDRVNWGAAIFFCVWVWIYGITPWIIGLTTLFLVPIPIEEAVVLFVSAPALSAAIAILNPIAMVAWWIVVVVFGLDANRIVWERRRREFSEAAGKPARPTPLWRYRKSAQFWTRLGLGLVALGVALDAVLIVLRPADALGALWAAPGIVVPLTILFVVDRIRLRRASAKLAGVLSGPRTK